MREEGICDRWVFVILLPELMNVCFCVNVCMCYVCMLSWGITAGWLSWFCLLYFRWSQLTNAPCSLLCKHAHTHKFTCTHTWVSNAHILRQMFARAHIIIIMSWWSSGHIKKLQRHTSLYNTHTRALFSPNSIRGSSMSPLKPPVQFIWFHYTQRERERGKLYCGGARQGLQWWFSLGAAG